MSTEPTTVEQRRTGKDLLLSYTGGFGTEGSIQQDLIVRHIHLSKYAIRVLN